MTVYKITNKINGKIYIGKTTWPLEKRWRRHLTVASCRKTPLYLAICKYGPESFSIKAEEECASLSELNEREKFWIKKERSQVRDAGYNLSEGGDGGKQSDSVYESIAAKRRGVPLTEEMRERISKGLRVYYSTHDKIVSKESSKKTGETLREMYKNGELTPPSWMYEGRCGENHPMFGKNHSKETKSKLSKARKGKTYNEVMPKETAGKLIEKRRKNFIKSKNPRYKSIDLSQLIEDIRLKMSVEELAKKYNFSKPGLYYKVLSETGKTIKQIRDEN